jgi:hypothetical protein
MNVAHLQVLYVADEKSVGGQRAEHVQVGILCLIFRRIDRGHRNVGPTGLVRTFNMPLPLPAEFFPD